MSRLPVAAMVLPVAVVPAQVPSPRSTVALDGVPVPRRDGATVPVPRAAALRLVRAEPSPELGG